MYYTSPLHIFDGNALPATDEASLKRLRKELLLQFDLHRQTTIRHHGREYDKATLLATFEDLKTRAEFHLRIYRNKDLLNFLERGELKFFSNLQSRMDLNDLAFRQQLAPYFTRQLSDIHYEGVLKKGFVSVNRLESITKAGFGVPPDLRNQVYAKTFTFFEDFLKRGRSLTVEPFVNGSDRVFRNEVLEYLHPHYLDILRVLPQDMFQRAIAEYGKLALRLLRKAFYRDWEFNDFSEDTLRHLLQATEICLFSDPNDEKRKKWAKGIRDQIHGISDGGDGGVEYAWLSIQILFGVPLFLIWLATCNTSSSHESRSPKPPNLSLQQKGFYSNSINSDLAGIWEGTFPLEHGSAWVKYSYQFFYSNGNVSLQYFDKAGAETCSMTQEFQWMPSIPNASSGKGGAPMERKHSIRLSSSTKNVAKINCIGLSAKELAAVSGLGINLIRGDEMEIVPVSYFPESGTNTKPKAIKLGGLRLERAF